MKTKLTDFTKKTPEERRKQKIKVRLYFLLNYILWPSVVWLFYYYVPPETPIEVRQEKFTWVVILISIVVSAGALIATELTSAKGKN
jgi:hypothetical protein